MKFLIKLYYYIRDKIIDIFYKIGFNLVAEVSNTNPFLNEGISIIYKLYFSPQINVTNVGEIETPEFENFWSQNIKNLYL